MKFFTFGCVHLVGFSGADLFSEFFIVTGKDELQELIIGKRTTSIKIVELHQQLHILDLKLFSVVILQEIVDVQAINTFVSISIDSCESCEGLKVI